MGFFGFSKASKPPVKVNKKPNSQQPAEQVVADVRTSANSPANTPTGSLPTVEIPPSLPQTPVVALKPEAPASSLPSVAPPPAIATVAPPPTASAPPATTTIPTIPSIAPINPVISQTSDAQDLDPEVPKKIPVIKPAPHPLKVPANDGTIEQIVTPVNANLTIVHHDAPPSFDERVKPKLSTAGVMCSPLLETIDRSNESETPKLLFMHLFNSLFDASFIADKSGYIIQGNRRVTTLLGYDPDDLWQVKIDKLVKGLSQKVLGMTMPTLEAGKHSVITAHAIPLIGEPFLAEVVIGTINFNKNPHLLISLRNIQKRSK